MTIHRAFGGPADGRWFPQGDHVLVATSINGPFDSLSTVWYELFSWAWHDKSVCPWERRQFPGEVHPHRAPCVWRGKAWVRLGDIQTHELITNTLNAIAGLCRLGTPATMGGHTPTTQEG